MSPGADEALALPSKYEGAFRALQASAPTKGSAACILLGNKRLAREGKPPLWRLAVYTWQCVRRTLRRNARTGRAAHPKIRPRSVRSKG